MISIEIGAFAATANAFDKVRLFSCSTANFYEKI